MAKIIFKNSELKRMFSDWCYEKGFVHISNMATGNVKKHWMPLKDRQWEYRNNYLKSEHWANLRSLKLAETPQCEVCGTTEDLDVHHKNYRNLYDVQLFQLEVLCRHHHSIRHSSDIGSAYEAFCAANAEFINSIPSEERGFYSERRKKNSRVEELEALKHHLLHKISRAQNGNPKMQSWLDKARSRMNQPKPRKTSAWSGRPVGRY